MASSSCPCPYTCENEINLRFYLIQVDSGAGKNQFGIYSPKTGHFGQTAVNDWILVESPAPDAKLVGRAQGVHIMSDVASVGWFASFNIVFQGDRFNGSTLQVMGVLSLEAEWAIVGGTGELAMARGTIKKREALPQPTPPPGSDIWQLDIHASYPKNSAECMELFEFYIVCPPFHSA
ncbi:hypothetical protein PR202_gb22072 [Eleusine coracana subsp. coracana]|uniref:Dirigent protein n=1 Tax=Eleusine coracana subsp. coracana TaxID=191504 RepID=A0AAV5FF00_ELECO|nr:hypothetical protein PR202_gb22072 [Eleusine coracana subsp. coracana]